MQIQRPSPQRNKSFWQKTGTSVRDLTHGAMRSDQYADVCIIGAGISGLTVAYKLLQAGKSVIIIERESTFGIHETGLTSAHLSFALDDRFCELIDNHGDAKARTYAESHQQAIDLIERICRDENIDCDFKRVDGYLFLDPTHKREYLENELAAAHSVGIMDVELLDRAPVETFNSGCCLRFPRQAQFHPVKYLLGLAEAVVKLGGRIYTETEAQEVVGGRGAYVRTAQGFCVHCSDIVVATNVPFNDRFTIQTKIAAYRSYVIGIEVAKDIFPETLLWDTSDPYHYIRLVDDTANNRKVLLVGGEDHRVGHEENPQRRFKRLMDWAQDVLNVDGPVVHRWSGQIIEPYDGPAYIGRNPGDENVYVVTGDSGHGLTHGTIAGILLRDLILKRTSPWEEAYDPARINIPSVANYLYEVAQSTGPYKDWLSPAEVNNIDDIPLGEGAILRKGLKKLAVYKSAQDEVKILSAVCPHLGGIVRWNDGEKTWDCPCHGSRFTCEGKIINGPAISGLHVEEIDGHTSTERVETPTEKLPLNPS